MPGSGPSRTAAGSERVTGRGARLVRRDSAWVVFAAAGAAAAVLFAVLPEGGLAQGILMVVVNGASVVAIALGLHWNRPAAPLPWLLLFAAQLVYLLASIVWYLYPVGWGGVLPYPSLLDGVYWLAYLGWAGFLALLVRSRGRHDHSVLLDAAIASAALATLTWTFLLEPVLTAPGVPLSAQAASTIYPVLLLTIAALSVRLALISFRFGPVEVLLGSWVTFELTGDVWYSLASAAGTFHYGDPWFTTWMLSYAALGALALHPDRDRLTLPAEQPAVAPPWLRLGLLGASVAAPVLAVASLAGPQRRLEAGVLSAVAVVTVALMLTRLATLVRDVRLERALRADLAALTRELEHAALHDGLTGLANRVAFTAAIDRALARRHSPGRTTAVLLMDLDSFKAVNDTHGHAVGDALLQAVAGRLVSLVREGDLVARLGGDEFVVIADDVDVRGALLLAQRVVSAIGEPAEVADVVLTPGVSLGVHTPGRDQGPDEAMASADAAMYAAKAAGGGFEVFDPDRHRQFIDRFRLELELREAAGNGELVLHYQPVVDLATRRVVAAEALVRWRHPTRGFLYPGAFIDVAEQSGAIVDVGRWVIRRACLDARSWQQRVPGAEQVGVALNLSRRQLRTSAVVDDVNEALQSTGLPSSLLTLEVTETALLSETGEMAGVLDKLKALGLEIAMDDFGTGYSSLSQLRSLPIDVLKIDKAFVDGIAREQEEWALAAAIVRLATSLGKRTLAEGIEHASQLAHLRTLGCELGQGFLFARPMPLADFEAFVAKSVQRS